MPYKIYPRGDIAANWTAVNPILRVTDIGIETDTDKFKLGNGVTAWNSLAYMDLATGAPGAGDVVGPASAVADRIVLFNGTTGKLIKDSGSLLSSLEPANANIQVHIASTSNPHFVTKSQVGLSAVPNTDATVAANITQDATHRFATDAEKTAWDAKQEALVSGTNIKTINGAPVLGSGDLVVSGATSATETEIDFGTTPVAEALFTITDAAITAAKKILCFVSYAAPTGKDQDELEMDDLQLRAVAGSGNFALYVRSADGSYLADKFKIYYIIAA